MASIPFIGPAYKLAALPESCQRAVNLYLEQAEQGGKAPAWLRQRQGRTALTLSVPLNAGGVRGLCPTTTFLYFVVGNTVYALAQDLTTVILIGSINSGAGLVSMSDNGVGGQVLIVDGVGGWIITKATNAFVAVAGSFPNGVSHCDYMDGFYVACGDGTSQWYKSAALDGTSWSGTDFGAVTGMPGALLNVVAMQSQAWLFKEKSTEAWINTGQAGFPYARNGNSASIEVGIAAPYSAAKLDNTVFWLGRDERGAGIVYRANGYTPQRVSDYGVETAIQGYIKAGITIADATAYAYQESGHAFYVLSFPTADATWTYDCATQSWHERQYRDPATNLPHRDRASVHAFYQGVQLLGDWQNNVLYRQSEDVYTDNGDPILRLRSTVPIADGAGLFFQYFSRLQIDFDPGVGITGTGQGSDPQVMLRWSDNGGKSWGNYHTGGIGKIGEFLHRTFWTRLGRARSRCWEVSWTDPIPGRIMDAVADITLGTA